MKFLFSKMNVASFSGKRIHGYRGMWPLIILKNGVGGGGVQVKWEGGKKLGTLKEIHATALIPVFIKSNQSNEIKPC